MEVHKDHAARKRGDGIGQALLHGPFMRSLETQARDGTNVALNDMGEEWGSLLGFFGEVHVLVCHTQTLAWRLVLQRRKHEQPQHTAQEAQLLWRQCASWAASRSSG